MAARLLTLQLFLQRNSIPKTHILLDMHPDFRYNNYACLYAAVFSRNYHAARAILCTIDDRSILQGLPYPLIELSVSCVDVNMTHLLLFHGVRPLLHSQVQEPALTLAMSRLRPGCDPSSTLIAAWLLKSSASTDECFCHHLARALLTFNQITNKRDFEAEQFIKVPAWGWLVHYVLDAVENAVPWLRGLFTIKLLAIYAAVIAVLDSRTESRAMQVLTFVGLVLFGSVALCPTLPVFGKSRQTASESISTNVARCSCSQNLYGTSHLYKKREIFVCQRFVAFARNHTSRPQAKFLRPCALKKRGIREAAKPSGALSYADGKSVAPGPGSQ